MFWIAHSLIVVALAMVVWILVLDNWSRAYGNTNKQYAVWSRAYGNTNKQYAVLAISFTLALLLYLICGLTLMANTSQVASMDTFYNQTRIAYQAHIEEEENTITIGSLPSVVLEAPFLQAVTQYNSDLASLRYYNSIPLIGDIVPDSINQLKYISTRFGE